MCDAVFLYIYIAIKEFILLLSFNFTINLYNFCQKYCIGWKPVLEKSVNNRFARFILTVTRAGAIKQDSGIGDDYLMNNQNQNRCLLSV